MHFSNASVFREKKNDGEAPKCIYKRTKINAQEVNTVVQDIYAQEAERRNLNFS